MGRGRATGATGATGWRINGLLWARDTILQSAKSVCLPGIKGSLEIHPPPPPPPPCRLGSGTLHVDSERLWRRARWVVIMTSGADKRGGNQGGLEHQCYLTVNYISVWQKHVSVVHPCNYGVMVADWRLCEQRHVEFKLWQKQEHVKGSSHVSLVHLFHSHFLYESLCCININRCRN